MKKILLGILTCFALCSLVSSCQKEDDKNNIYGTWGVYDYNSYVFLVFNENGYGCDYEVYKNKLYSAGEVNFKWEINGNTIHVTWENRSKDYLLKGDKLIESPDDDPIVYVKVSDSQVLPTSINSVVYP